MKKIATNIVRWVRENPWALLVALVGVFSAYLLLKSKHNKISTLKDAVAVKAAQADIVESETRATVIQASADARDDEVHAIDERITASMRRIVEINEGGVKKGATDAEIAALFHDSGL